MEQGRAEEDMKQQQQGDHYHHHRRLKPAVQSENQPQHHQQPPQQQPQKCPRCDSLNTKFCYYNNYSLSQPRYFCKSCKRYWTQGGTLRNVPVGGGCRKGKRTKAAASSGGENSRSHQLPITTPPPQPPQGTMLGTNLAIPSMSSYYAAGGFLSSLSAMHSLSHQSQPFNQPPYVGGQFGGSSNLAHLHGFKVPSFSSQEAQNQQIQQQNNEFYQMGNRDKNIESLYPSDLSLVQLNRPIGSWINQSLINSSGASATNPRAASNPSFLNTTNGSTTGTSLNPNQWPDLPAYGPPP